MKTLSYFNVKKSLLVILSSLPITALSTANNQTMNDDPHNNCICIDFSAYNRENFRKFYSNLEIPLRHDPSNTLLRQLREPFLKRIFLSLQNPEAEPVLYELFVEKLAYTTLRSAEGLEEQMKNNTLDWQDFKALFEFYGVGTVPYSTSLLTPEQYEALENLYEEYKDKLER
jgi:hypothetical protein